MSDFTSEKIRNIVLTGHSGSGKSTLAEAMLYAAKEISRMGSIAEGTTQSDFHPDEISRQHSLMLSVMHATWNNHKINVIDVPGLTDFLGDVKSGAHVAETMILTVDESTGVGYGADIAWEAAEELNMPVIFALTKADLEQAHFEESLEYLKQHFSRDIVPLEYPVYEGKTFVGAVNLLSLKTMRFANDQSGTHTDVAEVPDTVKEKVMQLREALMETLAESDETLMDIYFSNGILTEEEIDKGLKSALRKRKIYPVFVLSSTTNIGVTPLMDFIVDDCPSPAEVQQSETNSEPSIFIFKTINEHHVGELSFFRVYSGNVSAGLDLINNTNGSHERINQVFNINGKNRKDAGTLHSGDLGALVKLKKVHTNDTLTSKNITTKYPPTIYPNPIVDMSVIMKGKGDEAKIAEGLQQLHNEDPTFWVNVNAETNETIISGLGELQLEVLIQRLKARYNVEVETKIPKIPYREAIRASVQTTYRHKKQTGGAGQFGEVHFHIEPYDENKPIPHQFNVRGEEFEDLPWGGKLHFVNSIVGGAIDARFIPAVKKGVMEVMNHGPMAACPVSNVRIILYDGKMHPVDSNENAFKTAGKNCLKQGIKEAKPYLMEPVWELTILTPMESMGDIMGDLSSHRGRILGMDEKGTSQLIKAHIPLAELNGYASRLRSLTQGRGSYSRSFSHYEEVPKDVEAKVVAAAQHHDNDDE